MIHLILTLMLPAHVCHYVMLHRTNKLSSQPPLPSKKSNMVSKLASNDSKNVVATLL